MKATSADRYSGLRCVGWLLAIVLATALLASASGCARFGRLDARQKVEVVALGYEAGKLYLIELRDEGYLNAEESRRLDAAIVVGDTALAQARACAARGDRFGAEDALRVVLECVVKLRQLDNEVNPPTTAPWR